MTLFDQDPDDSHTVSSLGDAVAGAVHSALPSEVWVRGEIRDLSRASSGHVYFRLVEAGPADRPGGTVTASFPVMLSSRNKISVNRTLRDAGAGRLDDGTQVKIRGRVDWYAPRGRLQLLMTAVDPIYTLGQLAAERAAVVNRLRAEGIFDSNRRLAMPLLPLRVGLVTSLGSDAERDVLHELTGSAIGFSVRCFDVRVQGDQAPATIAGGIAALDGQVDVIVVARGGGGATDLQAFDSDRVARAICLAGIPVLTGIGHESDVSVADEVAHSFHKTPTAVAVALVEHVRAVHEVVEGTWQRIAARASTRLDGDSLLAERAAGRLTTAVRAALSTQQHSLARFTDRVGRVSDRALTSQQHRLDRLADRAARLGRGTLGDRTRTLADREARLAVAAGRGLRAAETSWAAHVQDLERQARSQLRAADRRLAAVASSIQLVDPVTTMARGWSITRTTDGRIVRSVGAVSDGDELLTTVADGTLRSSALRGE